jgi:hypothetical protein
VSTANAIEKITAETRTQRHIERMKTETRTPVSLQTQSRDVTKEFTTRSVGMQAPLKLKQEKTVPKKEHYKKNIHTIE